MKCTGLDKSTFDKLRKDKTNSWLCKTCINENIPFSNLDNDNLKSISKQTKVNNVKKLINFNKFCNICNKNNNDIEKAVPCHICKNLIHRKCSNLNTSYIENKLNLETYMCQVCDNTFPFTKLINIKGESFNSNCININNKNRQDKYNNNFKIDVEQILNLKKLIFNENTYHAKFDPDEEIKDNSNFSYYYQYISIFTSNLFYEH